MPSIFSVLISEKMATLTEIKNDLTHEDVLNLYDTIAINNYNNYIVNKISEKG